jgi:hypothetical protein
MRFTRLGLIAGLALASTLLLAPAPASAHGIRYARGVGGDFFPKSGPPYDSAKGVVTSGQPRCRRNSVVVLWRTSGGGPIRVGSANTGGDNTWVINPPGNFPNGTYFLTVKRKVLLRSGAHRHICPYLRTGTFTISNP